MSDIGSPWPERAIIVAGPPEREWFTAGELETATTFKLPKRCDEWLLSRYAAKRLARQLEIATDPCAVAVERPVLFVEGEPTGWFVSISHSAPYAAAALSREPVGIDVQVVREVHENAAHFFLTPAETEAMRTCSLPHRMLHFWSAKEAAWKQRSDEFDTLKKVPLRLVGATARGLLFDGAETVAIDDVIVALTR